MKKKRILTGYFRWLENTVIEIWKTTSIHLMINHLKLNPSKSTLNVTPDGDMHTTVFSDMLTIM